MRKRNTSLPTKQLYSQRWAAPAGGGLAKPSLATQAGMGRSAPGHLATLLKAGIDGLDPTLYEFCVFWPFRDEDPLNPSLVRVCGESVSLL